MCGIFTTNKKSLALEQLTNQLHRGTEGAGYIFTNSQNQTTNKGSNLWDILAELTTIWQGPGYCVFHHRIPTSTANTPATAHPFTHPILEAWQGVHNGIISNPGKVLSELYPKEAKSPWNVGNDSQAIITEVIDSITMGKRQALSSGYASVLVTNQNGELFIYRDQNQPDLFLTLFEDGGWIVSSEPYNEDSEEVEDDVIHQVKMGQDFTFDSFEYVNDFCLASQKQIFDYSQTGGKKKKKKKAKTKTDFWGLDLEAQEFDEIMSGWFFE